MVSIATAEWTYRMLENESLWQATRRAHEALASRRIPHAIVGGVAVCLHGYRRNTVDLDLLVDPDDVGFEWRSSSKEFQNSTGTTIQFVLSGDLEGKGQEAKFPSPKDARAITEIESLPVLSLSELIQSKIACGLGNPRRTHKDLADVVELIAVNRLDGAFARFLHKSVRKEFRILVRQAGSV